MSGKARQPRVKGNLKPTSSSRAADLVGDDTAAINAFKANPALAFSQFSRGSKAKSGAATPENGSGATTPNSVLDQIDGHLAAQLKRLGKHDAKTKMRALFELKAYIDEHTWETGLEGMMLAWPPLFRRHVFDPDRRVRASVVQVHADLVEKIGRRLAAQLRLVIGPWMAAYFDPHREVARTARHAFETVFSEAKRKEVFVFCSGELLEFATDNIVNQTVETMSDARFTDEQEMRSKYEHVVGASFGVLGLVIEETESNPLMERQAEFDVVLENKRTLDMIGSPSSYIRRSVYRLIRAMMLKCPELAATSHVALARALLKHCFSDSDPNAHGDMWDAVLLTTKNFPRVWISDGSGNKGPSPASRMFEFLRARCRLAPTISYPSVLALLANLPAEALDAPSFQQQFDAALWHGATESTDGSRSAHQGSRSAHREGVALVTAICECSAFLWTRTLKSTSDSDVVAAVGKEAAKQIDRLWHYYLQRPESAEEMAEPIVKLYCKIESLAAKYDRDLLARIWAQASWFALQRLNGAAIFPIVHLIARTAQLDTVSHADLVGHARKLLVAFCQLATQSPDDDAARSLIQLLSQHARDVVFEEGFADKFSARLERAGSVGDAVQLVLSRAQHVAQDTGSVEQAALSIDAYAAALLREAHTAESKALATVTELLTELPGSDVARTTGWASLARLPAVSTVLDDLLPSLRKDNKPIVPTEANAPATSLVRLYKQALVLHFTGMELFGDAVIGRVFEWTERVFTLVYHAQWASDMGEAAVEAWVRAAHEVLSVWIALARDERAGARFVRFWLDRSGGHGRSALGLLFDFSVSTDSDDATGIIPRKLGQQARRAWSATEAQLASQHLGAQLAQTLSETVVQDMDDMHTDKSAVHLARLASSIYTRVCPQDNVRALRELVDCWLFDESRFERLTGGKQLAARAACAAGGSGLWQAADDIAGSQSQSFHTLAHWHLSSNNQTQDLFAYDRSGLAQLARHTVFAMEFVRLSGGVAVLASASHDQLERFVLQSTLAFVLIREALLLASSHAEWACDAFGASVASVVDVEMADARVLAQADAAATQIQDVVSDVLELTVVHELPLTEAIELSGGAGKLGAPADSERWLNTLISALEGVESSSIWGRVIDRVLQDGGSAWILVLGRMIEWCVWAGAPDAAAVEAGLASALARMFQTAQTAAMTGVATVVMRAMDLRRLCARAPAMRSALLDVVGRAARTAESGNMGQLVAELELVAELLPAESETLNSEAPRIAKLVLALPSQLQNQSEDTGAAVVAALAIVQRLSMGTASLEAQTAVDLVRLCVRWITAANGVSAVTVLAAAARAIEALAQVQNVVDDAGVALRQAGQMLVTRCVLAERPVAAGVQATAALAEMQLADVPAFSSLYPVLASAPPRLNTALVRLVLANSDLASYIADDYDALARLAAASATRLHALDVSPAQLGTRAGSDEFMRDAGVRLLTALLLVAQFAAALDTSAYDDLTAQLAEQNVFDAAMPWMCGLLGLTPQPMAERSAFDARLWDAPCVDWTSWGAAVERCPSADHVLGVLALHVIHNLATALPTTLRTWWAGLPPAMRTTASSVERFVAQHISAIVADAEMERIRAQSSGDSGVLATALAEYDSASVRASTWQVAITYEVDDTALELTIRLPPSYPLSPAVFDAVRRVAVPEKRWRAWVVAAQAKLARCPRIDAVCAQVVANIGAHFTGVEDCAICYSAVGAMDNSLPNRQCKTCKNKFHRMCLFKWFSTSNQSTCPLCRNLF
ncbi:hypothetical protein IW139_001387 [Coemansia sp. RSA 353]|nr:hypothetical protein GGH16_000572 [Coemansia sp. RSA 560]KAJ2197813.1 hypothetical protein IW144_002227 [Coemansia sp. RSA 522]KAJ2299990.1 hypothetical protein IW139_001387 [Coemansia sp. RSA 353]KAJ2435359.1 hypothetical protein IWW41_000929 [Coemansia sp. RSA 2522]